MSQINNVVAYEAAKQASIHANANKTRSAKWHASNPDANRITDFLRAVGEFASVCKHCKTDWNTHMIRAGEYCFEPPTDKCRDALHPVVFFSGDLREKLRVALDEWGSLTEKQTTLVRSMIARGEEKSANLEQRRAEKLAADAATSHVGTVGERREFTLTIERVLSFDTHFGRTYINLCRDENNNVIVYKGSNDLTPWDDDCNRLPASHVVRVKATVKAHEVREGVPQTLIARPKVVAA
jgi:hypothetical protein